MFFPSGFLPLSRYTLISGEILRVETCIACAEADLENRPYARENCAELVRRAFLTDPRNLCKRCAGHPNMC